MKKILFVVLGLLSLNVNAQQSQIKEYVEVVEIPNMGKSQIFNATKVWIAKSFNSANSVIQYEDPATGSIIGKGNMNFPCQGTWNCLARKDDILLFTLKVDTKDNKARVSFNDMSVKINTKGTTKFVPIGQEINTVNEKDNELIQTGLKNIVQKYVNDIQKETLNSDW